MAMDMKASICDMDGDDDDDFQRFRNVLSRSDHL
jgi:hypothetical protein